MGKKILDKKTSVILILHGTKKILSLLFYKFIGVKIVLRLDGFFEDYSILSPYNSFKGFKHNLSAFCSILISHKIIMQSKFIYYKFPTLSKLFDHKISIIHNGVNIEKFKPKLNSNKSPHRLLIVEGGISSKYSKKIIEALSSLESFDIHIYGKLNFSLSNITAFKKHIKYFGVVSRDFTPKIYQQNQIYFCIEKNPACPNSVLEAMSSGLPIIGFDNGSLKELVGEAGIIIKVNKEITDIKSDDLSIIIKKSINNIISNYSHYSNLARKRAKIFDSKKTFNEYFKILTKYL